MNYIFFFLFLTMLTFCQSSREFLQDISVNHDYSWIVNGHLTMKHCHIAGQLFLNGKGTVDLIDVQCEKVNADEGILVHYESYESDSALDC